MRDPRRPSAAELREARAESVGLLAELRDVRQEVQGILDGVVRAQNERFAARVRIAETVITRGVETGDHATVVAAVTALLNSQEEMARDWNAALMER